MNVKEKTVSQTHRTGNKARCAGPQVWGTAMKCTLAREAQLYLMFRTASKYLDVFIYIPTHRSFIEPFEENKHIINIPGVTAVGASYVWKTYRDSITS